MKSSRISSKGQVTIPVEVREALDLKAGDLVVYEMDGDVVKLKKLEPFDAAFHLAVSETLQEWSSKEDEEAFGDL
jgi:AbrB family looped-hinge helix DNA binding protein